MKVVLLFILIHFSQCNQQPKTLIRKTSNEDLKTTIESFPDFYNRFHTDSVFQLNRISFPLPGFNSEVHFSNLENASIQIIDGEKVNYYWSKENWITHKPIELTSNIRSEQEKSDSMIIERIYIPDSEFEIKRIFKLLRSNWFLVYYKD